MPLEMLIPGEGLAAVGAKHHFGELARLTPSLEGGMKDRQQ